MKADELRAAGRLTGTTLGEVTSLVGELHAGISGRIFKLFGPAGQPIERVHDSIAKVAYLATSVGVTHGAPAISAAASLAVPRTATSVSATTRGAVILGALNGAWGDRFLREHQALAMTTSVSTHSGPRRHDVESLVADLRAEGAVTDRIVVFVHGLCETERQWWLRAERTWGDATVTYGSRLRDELGYTPLYVAYNSGRHVSENGADLDNLLTQLCTQWPVPVHSIALVGHSMGGLVTRSAAHLANSSAESPWVTKVRHMVYLATPHFGAPLERVTNAGTHLLQKLPETRRIAAWLNNRSAGVKDMRYGSLLDTHWDGHDPDERLVDHTDDVPLLTHARHYYVSATLSRDPDHPVGRWIGDLLVQHPSATGSANVSKTRRLEFEPANGMHIGRSSHFSVLNNREVYRQLRTWLSENQAESSVTVSRRQSDGRDVATTRQPPTEQKRRPRIRRRRRSAR